MAERTGLTALVGRDDAVRALELLLADGERLVTLAGPGGVGKTSLAHHLEQRWVGDGGSAWFVPCERWADPATLLDFVADQIGGGPGDPAAQISARFTDGVSLLILDNLEHLVAAGPAIAALVQMDERIRVLCTSRLALRVRGERVFEVEPLGAEAQVMLADRIESAGAPRPAANEPLLDELCELVDRLPLGIELAAARVPTLGLAGLTAMLRQDGSSLDNSTNAVDPRHRSLLGTVAESYDLLRSTTTQALYRRLGVVSGTFGIQLVAGLLGAERPGDAVAALAQLVELHLVKRVGDEPTYRMLVVVREHARQLLAEHGETLPTEQALVSWATRISHRRDPRDGEMTDAEHHAWMNVVTVEYPAILGALLIARRDADLAALRSLVANMRPYWISVGAVREGYRWAETAARLHRHDPAAYAELCFHTSALADYSHGADVALQWIERGVPAAEASGEWYFAARLLDTAGVTHAARGRLDEAEDCSRRAVELYRQLGLPSFVSSATAELANVAAVRGDLDAAEALYADVVAPLDEAGLDRLANVTRFYWADVARRNGNHERALQLLDKSERGLQADAMLADYAVAFRAHVFNDLGRFEHAHHLASGVAERAFAHGSSSVEANAVAAMARAVHHLGRREHAIQLVHRCVNLYAGIGNDFGLIDAVELAAEILPPGPDRRSLLAAANAMRARFGAVRPPTASARIPDADTTTAECATVSEVHHWIDAGAAVVTPAAVPAESVLTARELDVLRLVAEGLSDRTIANELFISVRTAQTHVAHIFTKLGVANRTSAVSAARHLGLID